MIWPLVWAFLRLDRRLKEKRHVGTWRCRGITPSRAKTGWTGLISFNDRCRDFGELREVILQARKLAVADIEKHQRDVPTSELLAALAPATAPALFAFASVKFDIDGVQIMQSALCVSPRDSDRKAS